MREIDRLVDDARTLQEVALPEEQTYTAARSHLEQIHEVHGLVPKSLGPTSEQSLVASYRENGVVLNVEFFHDGSAVACLSKREEFCDPAFDELIEQFKEMT